MNWQRIWQLPGKASILCLCACSQQKHLSWLNPLMVDRELLYSPRVVERSPFFFPYSYPRSVNYTFLLYSWWKPRKNRIQVWGGGGNTSTSCPSRWWSGLEWFPMYQESATRDKTRTSVGCISSDCTKTSTISPVLFLAMCNIFFGNHYERSGRPLFQAQTISEKGLHYHWDWE